MTTTYSEGELAAARRLYVPSAHRNLSFDDFADQHADELAKLVKEAKERADAVGEDLDNLEAPSNEKEPPDPKPMKDTEHDKGYDSALEGLSEEDKAQVKRNEEEAKARREGKITDDDKES